MKKTLLILPALMLAACTPSQSGPVSPTRDAFTLTATVNGAAVEAGLGAEGWTITQPGYVLKVDFNPSNDGFRFGSTPTQGFRVEVQNKGTLAAKVVWDETTVSLRGNTSGVIPDGTKYIDAERSKPSMIVPPGVTSSKEIVPASSVSWTGKDWYTLPLFPANIGKSNVTLYLTIEQEKKDGVTLNFAKK